MKSLFIAIGLLCFVCYNVDGITRYSTLVRNICIIRDWNSKSTEHFSNGLAKATNTSGLQLYFGESMTNQRGALVFYRNNSFLGPGFQVNIMDYYDFHGYTLGFTPGTIFTQGGIWVVQPKVGITSDQFRGMEIMYIGGIRCMTVYIDIDEDDTREAIDRTKDQVKHQLKYWGYNLKTIPIIEGSIQKAMKTDEVTADFLEVFKQVPIIQLTVHNFPGIWAQKTAKGQYVTGYVYVYQNFVSGQAVKFRVYDNVAEDYMQIMERPVYMTSGVVYGLGSPFRRGETRYVTVQLDFEDGKLFHWEDIAMYSVANGDLIAGGWNTMAY